MPGSTITFTLRADTAEGVAALEKMKRSFSDVGDTADTSHKKAAESSGILGGALSNVTTIAAGMGVTFGALQVAGSIRGMADDAFAFQEAWTRVDVILRNTPREEVEKLKGDILGLNPALGTSRDMALALYQAVSSGVTDPTEALALVKNAAIAAAGGFTSVETALKSGAAVMAAYGIKAADSQHIFDVMAKTVDLGVISFEELSTSLGAVTPIAAANKVSFEEVSASVAAMTLNGVGASEAVTGLRSLLTSIIDPTDEASKKAAELGVKWDAQTLQTQGLTAMLAQLKGRTDITTTDIATLTGRVEATNTALALTSQSGAKNFQDALDQLSHASSGLGAALESQRAQAETLTGKWNELKSSFTNLASEIGNKLAPALSSVVGFMTGLIATAKDFMDGGLIAYITGGAAGFAKWKAEQLLFNDTMSVAEKMTKAVTDKFKEMNQVVPQTTSATSNHKNEVVRLTEEQKKQIKAQEELFAKFNDSLKPMSAITAEYVKLQTAGVSFDDFVVKNHDNIVKQSRAQIDNGKSLSDLDVELVAASIKMSEHDRVIREGAAAYLELKTKIDQAADSFVLTKPTIDKYTGSMNLAGVSVKDINELEVKFPKNIKDAVQKDGAEATTIWSGQMSTIKSDWSKAVEEILFSGAGLGETLLGVMGQTGKSAVRGFMESLEGGLTSSLKQSFSGGGSIASSVKGSILGLFSDIKGSLKDLAANILSGGVSALIGSGVSWVVNGIKSLFSKDPLDSASKEVARDFGNISISSDAIGSFINQIGLAKDAFKNARKEILSSPLFLQLAYETAQAQGKTDQFLASLTHVQTTIGTFDFSKAFNVGLVTGDWTQLNEQFAATIGTSDRLLAVMPDFATKLSAISTSASGAYTEFSNLVDEFNETYVITPQLAETFKALGGNMDVLNNATQIPGLKSLLGDFTSLKAKIDELIPQEKSAIDTFVETGEVTDELAEKIVAAKGNMDVFLDFQKTKNMTATWDDLVASFKETSKVSSSMADILSEYGYSAEQIATISKDNIDTIASDISTKLDAAYIASAQRLSDELGKMNGGLESSIQELVTQLKTEMDKLSTAIVTAIGGLGTSLTGTLDEFMLAWANLQTYVDNNPIEGNVDIDYSNGNIDENIDSNFDPVGSFASGTDYVPRTGWAYVHQGEKITPASVNNSDSRVNITVNIPGPIYGMDDLDKKIANSITRSIERGGLRSITQRA